MDEYIDFLTLRGRDSSRRLKNPLTNILEQRRFNLFPWSTAHLHAVHRAIRPDSITHFRIT